MLHSAGIHHGSAIRFAAPADFQQDRPTVTRPARPGGDGHYAGGHRTYPDDTLQEDIQGKSEKSLGISMEWHKDTVTFVEDWPPHEDDMFASWQI